MKRYILSALAAAAALCACQDDWDEHYDQQADSQYGTASLYEIIAQRPELSDFRAVLDSTRLFANNRITATHYSKLLAEDQFLTVWAPVNGTFNRALHHFAGDILDFVLNGFLGSLDSCLAQTFQEALSTYIHIGEHQCGECQKNQFFHSNQFIYSK